MKTAEDVLQEMIRKLEKLAQNNEPNIMLPALGGMLGSFAGQLPQEYFDRMVKCEPCGRPGCTCHVFPMPAVANALTCLREDYIKFKAEVETEMDKGESFPV